VEFSKGSSEITKTGIELASRYFPQNFFSGKPMTSTQSPLLAYENRLNLKQREDFPVKKIRVHYFFTIERDISLFLKNISVQFVITEGNSE